MILRKAELKETIQRCLDIMSDTVGSTMGPNGKLVILKDFNGERVTKDGVSVATQITSELAEENAIYNIIKEVAINTANKAGDGTTTSIQLANVFYKILEYSNMDEEIMDNIIDDFLILFDTPENVNKKYPGTIITEPSKEDILNTIKVSVNGDTCLAMVSADVVSNISQFEDVSFYKASTDYMTKSDAYVIERGWINHAFSTDGNPITLENVSIIITDEPKLNLSRQVVNLIEPFTEDSTKSLLIICRNMVDEALSTCILNANKYGNIAVVQCPNWGERLEAMLSDIAHVTECIPILTNYGRSLMDMQDEYVGFAKKVVVTSYNTEIFVNDGSERYSSIVAKRIKAINKEIENIKLGNGEFKEARISFNKTRMSKLLNKEVQMFIAAETDTHYKERFDRAEDAIKAGLCALEEGIILGGTYGFRTMMKMCTDKYKQNDITVYGIPIHDVLTYHLYGKHYNKAIEAMDCDIPGIYNLTTKTITNPKDCKIYDPVIVLKTAVKNAYEIAKTLHNCENLVVLKSSR